MLLALAPKSAAAAAASVPLLAEMADAAEPNQDQVQASPRATSYVRRWYRRERAPILKTPALEVCPNMASRAALICYLTVTRCWHINSGWASMIRLQATQLPNSTIRVTNPTHACHRRCQFLPLHSWHLRPHTIRLLSAPAQCRPTPLYTSKRNTPTSSSCGRNRRRPAAE